MALEQLKQIKGLLEGSAEPGKLRLRRKDRIALARERDRMARDLHKKLGLLQEIMKHPTIGGKLNLGTNVETVNWSLMPESVAKCFRPEFDYQPEEITQFYAQSSDMSAGEERFVGIYLDRNGSWWSHVQAGSIVRRKNGRLSRLDCMGYAYIECNASQAQPQAAREAMGGIKHSLSLHSSGREPEGEELGFIISDINKLRLGEDILSFVMAGIQNRIQTPQSR